MDDEDFMLSVLTDLQAVLEPVVNSGASRDQLADAAKKALGIVGDAFDVIEQDEDDEEDDEEYDDDEDEEEEPVHEPEEEGKH